MVAVYAFVNNRAFCYFQVLILFAFTYSASRATVKDYAHSLAHHQLPQSAHATIHQQNAEFGAEEAIRWRRPSHKSEREGTSEGNSATDIKGEEIRSPEQRLQSNPTPAPQQDDYTSAPFLADVATPSPITPIPTPVPTMEPSTLFPVTAAPVLKPTSAPEVPHTMAGTTVPPTSANTQAPSQPHNDKSDLEKVKTPRFLESSDSQVTVVTLHIVCDTEGATIHYTLDGGAPSEKSATPDNSGRVVVTKIGTHTIRAIGVKEGMQNSDEAKKEFTVEDRVATPEPSFEGEEDPYYQGDGVAFLRLVTITMNCETPNVTIFYTTDGVTEPGDDSPLSVSPGSELIWSEEGTTTFKAIAFADGDLYKSDVNSWDVTITAPRIDEFGVAGVHGADKEMHPRVQVTAFEALFAPPGAELEQQERMGPGFGSSCDQEWRIVRGKLLRVMNPSNHFSFVAPEGACGDPDDASSPGALALASKTERNFEATMRREAKLEDGESPEEAYARLRLDEREAAWRAAQGLGCQAAVAGGLLGAPGGAAGCVGHLVTGGKVLRADNSTGLVSFGVRGGKYVVGMVTNEEVLDESNPFQDLISGAGWLVRSGVNHVDASARDGHLDYLRDIGTGSGDGGRDHGEAPGEGLDDVLTAKLARTALGYDAEGRLILLQTSGAALGADQDTSVQDGLDLFELADVMVEAGAMSAINLVGGGVASMTENQSSIVDPAGDCLGPSGVESAIGFGDESKLARCEVPVSSIVCVHLDPPPFVPGFSGTPAPTPAQGSSSANGGGGAGDGKGDDQHDTWAHSEQDACDDTFNGNVTVWQHLDDVEEAVWRYKIAFWVVAFLGMLSLYCNIQFFKVASTFYPVSGGGSAYRSRGGNVAESAAPPVATTGVEMPKVGKRGSRSGTGRKKSSSGSGGGKGPGGRGSYAPVNGDNYDDEADAGMRGETGDLNNFYAESDEEEEVDLGLIHSRSKTSRKREKSKGGRLRRALARVSKGGEAGQTQPAPSAAGASDLDSDADMAINPFMGRGAGQRRHEQNGRGGSRHGHKDAGSWV